MNRYRGPTLETLANFAIWKHVPEASIRKAWQYWPEEDKPLVRIVQRRYLRKYYALAELEAWWGRVLLKYNYRTVEELAYDRANYITICSLAKELNVYPQYLQRRMHPFEGKEPPKPKKKRKKVRLYDQQELLDWFDNPSLLAHRIN